MYQSFADYNMYENPIDKLVDYLTVEDILIDLLDDKSFKAKVVSYPSQLYHDVDFIDISINEIMNMIDLETYDKIGRYSKNRLSICEMSYENSDLNQLYTETAIPMRSKAITRNFEVIKSNMLLVIKVTGDNSKFFYENRLFMDTYDRLRTYLKEDLVFQSNKSLDDKKNNCYRI